MRDGSHSQAFLSLFTTPDRAASIVGDLLEESHPLGRAWYSLKIVGIAFALCLQSIRAAPGRCLGLAALAWALFLCAFAACFVAGGLPWYAWQRTNEPEFWIRLALVLISANLLTGAILARWVSFRGTNAIVPVVVLWLVAWLVSSVVRTLMHTGLLAQVFGVLGFPFFYLLPLVVGGAIARRRGNARTTPSAQ